MSAEEEFLLYPIDTEIGLLQSGLPHTLPDGTALAADFIQERPDHLNLGIAGTLMRGGGSGATAGALFLPLWSSICAEPIKAPLAANPAEPAVKPPARANAAAGTAKARKTKAIFVVVFDIRNLHLISPERRKV
jgi:hypothetical protein